MVWVLTILTSYFCQILILCVDHTPGNLHPIDITYAILVECKSDNDCSGKGDKTQCDTGTNTCGKSLFNQLLSKRKIYNLPVFCAP